MTFEAAVRIFESFTVEEQDERFDYEEIRQTAIEVVNNLEFYVVFTDVAEDERRVISARPANKHERQVYWEARRRN
ncbi:MAG: BrnT family toxin [Alphaproteobacteria bacterium]|nr:BrnT family toxin [Alphaproteobacteria bacterium]